jgi:hypothetical protein
MPTKKHTVALVGGPLDGDVRKLVRLFDTTIFDVRGEDGQYRYYEYRRTGCVTKRGHPEYLFLRNLFLKGKTK